MCGRAHCISAGIFARYADKDISTGDMKQHRVTRVKLVGGFVPNGGYLSTELRISPGI